MTRKLTESNSQRIGKTYDEIFGETQAQQLRHQLAESHTGLKQSLDTRKKRSNALKGRTHPPSALKKLSETRKEGFRTGKIQLSPKAGNGRGGFKEDIGHYVRSSYEHTFAKMLQENSIEYDYEPVRFDLIVDSVHTGYTPDFKIKNRYYEIKNPHNVNDPVFRAKLTALHEQHNVSVTVLIGPSFSVSDITGS